MPPRNLLQQPLNTDQNVQKQPRNLLTNPPSQQNNNSIQPNEMNIIQRIGKNISSPETRPIGLTPFGVVLSSFGIPEENILPVVGGILGGMGGSRIGQTSVGVGLGTGAGNLAQQAIKKLARGGNDIDIGDAVIVGGLAGLGTKAIDMAFKSAGVAFQIVPEKARAKFFEKSLQAVNIGRKALSRNWQRAVTKLVEDNPNTLVNLEGVVGQLKNQFEEIGDDTLIPQLKSVVKKNPKLMRLIESEKTASDILENKPNLASRLTLTDAQELKNAITSVTQTTIKKAVKGKTPPNERIALEVIDKIDDAITSSFQQMAQVRRIYKTGKDAFNLARPLVEPGVNVEKSIFSKPQGVLGTGGTPFMQSTQGKLAFQQITGMTEAGHRLFAAAELAHKLNRAADSIWRIGQYATYGAIARKVFRGGNRRTE